jgi:hypothetical protein
MATTRSRADGESRYDVPKKARLEGFNMNLLNSLIDGASVVGLAVYCTGMVLVVGALAWANHVDHRRNTRREATTKR